VTIYIGPPTHDQVKFDGYTEAWPSESLRVESLAEILRLLYPDERSVRSAAFPFN